jgi:hypothetical protein
MTRTPTRSFSLNLAAAAAAVASLYAALSSLSWATGELLSNGGACAIGGPYEIEHACSNVALVVPVATISMLISGATFLIFMRRLRVGCRLPVLLAWPVLFISLGWNLFKSGFPFGGDRAIVVGYVVSGVLFVVMGGVPLGLLLRPSTLKKKMRLDGHPGRARIHLVLAVAAICGVWAGILLASS